MLDATIITSYFKDKVFPTLIPFTKTKTFACIITAVLSIVLYSIYDNYKRENALQTIMHQTDSLRIEIKIKDSQYDKLRIQADSLDEAILTAKGRVEYITKSFPEYRRPVIQNTDSATEFIKSFIKE